MDGTDGLFYIDGDDRLTTMVVTPYEAEDVLQELLTRHPDLLAGGQMDPHEPRQWLLVAREHGIPDRADAPGTRWSVDHLFVDQDAIPTLVEVKRSSDTRIRREVVGQMLDYAANGVLYWPVDRLREAFTNTQREAGDDPDDSVRRLTEGSDQDVESFFDRVFENLRAGRVRLVFVADVIPDELQRIVEFLNTQMSPAEVFGVEVKQYAAPGFAGRTIVPRVIGRTANAMTKQSNTRTQLSAKDHRDQAHAATQELGERLARWAAERGLSVRETRQTRQVRRPDGSTLVQLYYHPYNALDIDMTAVEARAGQELADAIRGRLQQLTDKHLTQKWPSVPAEDIVRSWPSFLPILDQLASTASGR